MGSGRSIFRVPFVEWIGIHVWMCDPPLPFLEVCFLVSFLWLGVWIRSSGVFFRGKTYFYVFSALWNDYVGFGSFFLWKPLALDPSLSSSPAVMRSCKISEQCFSLQV
jgi:hypothetical protein